MLCPSPGRWRLCDSEEKSNRLCLHWQKYVILQGSSIVRGKMARQVSPFWSSWDILVLHSEKVRVLSVHPRDVHPSFCHNCKFYAEQAIYILLVYLHLYEH